MRWLKRIAIGVSTLLAFLLLLGLGLGLLLWFQPQLLLNGTRAKQALRWLPQGWAVSWDKLDFSFQPLGFEGKNVGLSAENLCLKIPGTIDTCVNRLELAVTVRWHSFKPRLDQVGELVMDVEHAWIPPGGKKETKLPSRLDLRPPSLVAMIPGQIELIRELELRVRSFRLEAAEGPPTEGNLWIKKSPGTPEFSIQATVSKKPDLAAKLSADAQVRVSKLSLQGEVEGNLFGWRGHIPLRLKWGDTIALQANPYLRRRPHVIDTTLILAWGPKLIRAEIGPFASKSLWKQGRIETKNCAIEAKLGKAGFPGQASLSCGLALRPKNRLIPTLRADVAGKADLSQIRSDTWKANFTLTEKSADSFFESALAANGKLTVSGGKVEDPDIHLSLQAKIPEFKVWKDSWVGTPLAVPAPFHTMNGPIELSVESNVTDRKVLHATLSLKSNLKSTRQSFVVNAGAQAEVSDPFEKPAVKVSAKARLEDVALEAPPLSLSSPPQFLPDNRFVTTKEARREEKENKKQSSSTPLEWSLDLETGKPLRIFTNLLPKPAAIAANLRLGSAEGMQGHIDLQPMTVNIFRKKAEVKKFRVTWQPGSKVGELNGRIDDKTAEVLVHILVLGSTESPRVEFESEPPLSRQQIISVLLFNKSLAELTDEEASSTQNMSQALSDGALGLFSLFFLSSTPIQSVGYDPVTQSYSARVSLGGKTTLSVGSDFSDTKEVGLRRQLGGPWAISTELKQEQDRPDVVLTLLEWFKRF